MRMSILQLHDALCLHDMHCGATGVDAYEHTATMTLP
jgi:hypothetical protein